MEPLNVFDYETLAQTRLDAGTWAYFAGGADGEVTLRANRQAFERTRLRPRVLVDVRTISLETHVLNIPVTMPILISPVGFQGLAHTEGECATARASGASGTVMVVSTHASRTLEEVAQATTGTLWFQLSAPSRSWTEHLIQRAIHAGYSAFVLTIDAPYSGSKANAFRQGFSFPPSEANIPNTFGERMFKPLSTWDLLCWVRSLTSLPVLLKGILTAEDARLATDNGANGIIVSNHGGRQLDGVPPTLEALPDIVEAVRGQCEVYLDSGVRRGTDVLKALALGAHAVFVGRPIVWGLTVDGATGVANVLELLRAELKRAMALAGCPTLASITRSLVKVPS